MTLGSPSRRSIRGRKKKGGEEESMSGRGDKEINVDFYIIQGPWFILCLSWQAKGTEQDELKQTNKQIFNYLRSHKNTKYYIQLLCLSILFSKRGQAQKQIPISLNTSQKNWFFWGKANSSFLSYWNSVFVLFVCDLFWSRKNIKYRTELVWLLRFEYFVQHFWMSLSERGELGKPATKPQIPLDFSRMA